MSDTARKPTEAELLADAKRGVIGSVEHAISLEDLLRRLRDRVNMIESDLRTDAALATMLRA